MHEGYYDDDFRHWWADPFKTTLPHYEGTLFSGIAVTDDFGDLAPADPIRRWYSMNT